MTRSPTLISQTHQDEVCKESRFWEEMKHACLCYLGMVAEALPFLMPPTNFNLRQTNFDIQDRDGCPELKVLLGFLSTVESKQASTGTVRMVKLHP